MKLFFLLFCLHFCVQVYAIEKQDEDSVKQSQKNNLKSDEKHIKVENHKDFSKFLMQSKLKKNVIYKFLRIISWMKAQTVRRSIPKTKKLIYPFGGGDLAYPLIFFPDTSEIIIIGLEYAGEAIDSTRSLNVEVNLHVLYELGYFRTRQMEKIPKKHGMATLMYHQLMDLGAKDIKYSFFPKGFHIRFILNGCEKHVVYYSVNLNNSNKDKWLECLKDEEDFTIFLKGASYILQQENFEEIRNFLIVRAKVIVQDDTGFNYKFILSNLFKVYLYGWYWEPLYSVDNFHIYFQRPLMLGYLNLEEDVNIFDISYNEPNWSISIKDDLL